MRQLIIARKDLHMSPGKLAAQVSHASMAFLTAAIKKGGKTESASLDDGEPNNYEVFFRMDKDTYGIVEEVNECRQAL